MLPVGRVNLQPASHFPQARSPRYHFAYQAMPCAFIAQDPLFLTSIGILVGFLRVRDLQPKLLIPYHFLIGQFHHSTFLAIPFRPHCPLLIVRALDGFGILFKLGPDSR